MNGEGGADYSISQTGQVKPDNITGIPQKEDASTALRRLAGGKEETGLTFAEKHPDWPPIKIKFYLSAHDTADDLAGIKNFMSSADIYLYENVFGNNNTRVLQEIANMDPTTLPPDHLDKMIQHSIIKDRFSRKVSPLQGTEAESQWRALYGSRKIIGHIDLRPGDPINAADNDIEGSEYDVPDFDVTLDNLLKNHRRNVQFQDKRESIMLDRFEEELEVIMRDHPELKEKPEINILATMGAAHSSLARKFDANGIQAERVFSQRPYYYDYAEQINRELANGIEPNRTLLARAYLTNLVNSFLVSITINDKKAPYTNLLASRFSMQEIEEIHRIQNNGGLTNIMFNDLLRAKGIDPLPMSNEQLDSYLTRQKEAYDARVAEIKARRE